MRLFNFEARSTNIPLWKAYYSVLKMWVGEVWASEGAGSPGKKRGGAGGIISASTSPHPHLKGVVISFPKRYVEAIYL